MTDNSRYDWISDLVDGRLTGSELESAQRELAENAEARQLHQQFLSMRESLQALPKLKLDAEFRQRVMRQVSQVSEVNLAGAKSDETGLLNVESSQSVTSVMQPAGKGPNSRFPWRAVVASISAVAALLIVGLFIFPPGDNFSPVADRTEKNSVESDKSNNSEPVTTESGPESVDSHIDTQDLSALEKSAKRRSKYDGTGSANVKLTPESLRQEKQLGLQESNPFAEEEELSRGTQNSTSSRSLAFVDLTSRPSKDVERILTDSGITFVSGSAMPKNKLQAAREREKKPEETSPSVAESIAEQEQLRDRALADDYEVLVVEAPAETIQRVIETFGEGTDIEIAQLDRLSGLITENFGNENHGLEFQAQKTDAVQLARSQKSGQALVDGHEFPKKESGKVASPIELKSIAEGTRDNKEILADKPSDQLTEAKDGKADNSFAAEADLDAAGADSHRKTTELATPVDGMKLNGFARRIQVSPALVQEIRSTFKLRNSAIALKKGEEVDKKRASETRTDKNEAVEGNSDATHRARSSAGKPSRILQPDPESSTSDPFDGSADAPTGKEGKQGKSKDTPDDESQQSANRDEDRKSRLKQLEAKKGEVFRLMIIVNRSSADE